MAPLQKLIPHAVQKCNKFLKHLKMLKILNIKNWEILNIMKKIDKKIFEKLRQFYEERINMFFCFPSGDGIWVLLN